MGQTGGTEGISGNDRQSALSSRPANLRSTRETSTRKALCCLDQPRGCDKFSRRRGKAALPYSTDFSNKEMTYENNDVSNTVYAPSILILIVILLLISRGLRLRVRVRLRHGLPWSAWPQLLSPALATEISRNCPRRRGENRAGGGGADIRAHRNPRNLQQKDADGSWSWFSPGETGELSGDDGQLNPPVSG